MDFWYLRPFIIAVIEVVLSIIILRRGKLLKHELALFCLLLAGYQAGEFLLLNDIGDRIGYQLAMFSTTLLPPLGIYFVNRFSHHKWGYLAWQLVGGLFAITFLANPYIITKLDVQYCFCKFAGYSENWTPFLLAWGIYYLGCLTYACAVLTWVWIRQKHYKARLVKYIWLTYMSFFPTSFGLVAIWNQNLAYLASVMCTLALFAAVMATYTSLKFRNREL